MIYRRNFIFIIIFFFLSACVKSTFTGAYRGKNKFKQTVELHINEDSTFYFEVHKPIFPNFSGGSWSIINEELILSSDSVFIFFGNPKKISPMRRRPNYIFWTDKRVKIKRNKIVLKSDSLISFGKKRISLSLYDSATKDNKVFWNK
jgi:hypothetical protein